MYREIEKCLICGNADLEPIISLGEMHMTGIFPSESDPPVTSGPLEIVKCVESGGNECGLVQLKQIYEPQEMYGMNYGYRSGLNASMVRHLREIVGMICKRAAPEPGDLILDIGSNDGTLLSQYPAGDYQLLGVDPTGLKFKKYYPDHISLIPQFFSAKAVEERVGSQKARVITSIAMFYDLEDPLHFMGQIHQCLDTEGIWVLEQSYMPLMLSMTAYDTICHEHLEYYGMRQMQWMAQRSGFKVLDVIFNDVNGGSFLVVMAKKESSHRENTDLINSIISRELDLGLNTMEPYHEFRGQVAKHKDALLAFFEKAAKNKQTVLGYGASTKGNVVLQYCGLGPNHLACIAEINEDKFGCRTPGTQIPIVSEQQARAMRPNYFMVLPWHFKESIMRREQAFLQGGGTLVMPLPKIELIRNKG